MLYKYEMKTFKNAEELKTKYPKIYDELLAEKGAGEWENEDLFLFLAVVDFAEYEVFEGWYGLGYFASEISGGSGAPDLFEYIDYEELANDLMHTWDDSIFHKTKDNQIIRTDFGW
ncbi:TPA: hypothetical protein R1960_000785 [Staphylococcus delphini]|nr:hypothetical protein [Staphylococcus delphini]